MAHLPERHRQHLEWTPGRFLQWAEQIGPQTLAVVTHLLHERPHPEHGYRARLGLCRLTRLYALSRLEAACARAQQLGAPSYRSINNILKRRLDEQPSPETLELGGEEANDESANTSLHDNVRGPGYYH